MNTYRRFPVTFTQGRGCWLWDLHGERYMDCVAGIAVCSLGHSDPVLQQALNEQLGRLQHVSNLYFTPEQGELATWITANSPMDAVFFCNSGAEANEAAIKLARKYGRCKRGIEQARIVTARASFHGRTMASLSATGQPKYHQGFTPLVEGFHYVDYNDFPAIQQCIDRLDAQGPAVAAVLLEPLQGEGGVRPGDPGVFAALRQLCAQRGILLILDEVQVGMGRTGQLWGHQHQGIEPDAMTMAKGLGGGFPIGALAVKHHCDVLQPGDHASTFGGNPLACRAALTVAVELQRRHLLTNVQQRGEQLGRGLEELVVEFPKLCAAVRGWGLIQGLVLREGGPGAAQVAQACLQHKLLVVPAGNQVVRLVPPLTITRAEIDTALVRLRTALGGLGA
ncbi:MAG: aspartate aminotransferase family protein [Synechococcus sp. SB0672_bin_6]|nr:aspartate aminotransferase family protein [Synechococcus sp. SB0672_bin_6]